MIRFSLSTIGNTHLRNLLKVGLDDYITLFVTPTSCYFITNTMDVYMHKAVPLLSSENLTESLNFRMERKKLSNLMIEGTMVFNILDKIISITFNDKEGKTLYNMEVPNQTGFNEIILNKMNLITKCRDYPEINIEPLKSLARVASNLKLPITVADGYAFAGNPSFTCFKQVNLPDISLNSRHLVLLSKFAERVYNVQNYIIHDEDGLAIVLTKYKSSAVFDIDFVLRQPSSHRVVCNVGNIIDLCSKVDKTDGVFTLDVEHSKAKFTKDKVVYSTPLEIKDIRSVKKNRKDREKENVSALDMLDNLDFSMNAGGVLSVSEHDVPTINIPTIVIMKLLPALGLKRITTISYKKTFIQINGGGTYITFARTEV